MTFKLVFWDWMGTLFSHDFLYKSRLKNLVNIGEISSNLDFDNLSFIDGLQIKAKMKRFKSSKIPFTWFLVHSFTKLGVLQVIVSNGIESMILKELKDFNPFDLILTSEEFEPKPALDMLLYAMDTLNIHDKKEILFIGDSLIDQKAALDLGIKFFKINDDYYESAYEIAKELNFI